MGDRPSVLVVGGGAIGLCTAYYLRRAGADVTLVDKNLCGSGASRGNAGWIVPSLSAPIPGPGLPLQTLRWLARADSPVHIRPRLDVEFGSWLWRFWRACGKRAQEAGLLALANLNADTFHLFDRISADSVRFEMRRTGLVFAFLNQRGAESELANMEWLRDQGYDLPNSALSGAALRELEPALSMNVHGGFLVEPERHVDPGSFATGLAVRLREMGTVIHEHTCVRGFGRTAAKVTSVRTTVGELEADVVVLAAGAQTARLTKMVGHRVPMQPGKGYSFSIASQAPPRHALYLGEAKIGCSPLEGRTRIAGTMELPGDNVRLDMRRIDSMERSARQYLVEWPEGGATELWAGQRPLTPDGLPVIDRLGDLENTYVSTGHSTLGITLAPSSGLALCQYVLEGQRPPVLSPFAFDRF